MKFLFAIPLTLALASACLAADSTDPRDRPELGHQIKQAKQEFRASRASSWRRYKAHKLEGKAKALRTADEAK